MDPSYYAHIVDYDGVEGFCMVCEGAIGHHTNDDIDNCLERFQLERR